MRKIIKYGVMIGIATALALLILFFTLFKFEQTASTQQQMLGDMLWISAPDGGVGFRILTSDHPNYRVKVLCGTPDSVCSEGVYHYTGSKLKAVNVEDIASYFGDDIGLINGESMVKVTH